MKLELPFKVEIKGSGVVRKADGTVKYDNKETNKMKESKDGRNARNSNS